MEIKENYYELLETERLSVAPWKLEYVKKMYENWATDKEVTKFLPWEPHKNPAETEQIVSNWIQEKNYNWCIIEKSSGEPVGSINVVNRSDKDFRCEVGYCLSKKCWNKGYMTEALKAVVNFLFSEGYYKVYLKHVAENEASGRVMQKAGLIYQGLVPSHCFIKGRFYDCKVYYTINPNIHVNKNN